MSDEHTEQLSDNFARTIERAVGRDIVTPAQRARFARGVERGRLRSPLAEAAEHALTVLQCRYTFRAAPQPGCSCPPCQSATNLRHAIDVDGVIGGGT